VNSHSLFAVARPSVCRLSVVCNARAPYSGTCNFRQSFYDVWYLGPSVDIHWKFHADRPRGTPPPGELNARGEAKYSDFEPIGNRIWAFDWYQNRWPWMTLNGLMALFCVISANSGSFREHCILDTYWYLMMSGSVSRSFYMPHSAQPSRRFLKLFTELHKSSRSLSHLLMSSCLYMLWHCRK